MLQTIYASIYVLYNNLKNQGYYLATNTYKSIIISSLVTGILLLLLSYIFITIGTKKELDRANKKNILFLIPFVHLYIYFNLVCKEKVMGMPKQVAGILISCSIFVSMGFNLFVDINYVAEPLYKVLTFTGEKITLSPIGINTGIYVISNILNVLQIVAIFVFTLGFLKFKTPNYVLYSIFSLLVWILTPIFVFAYRNKDNIDYAQENLKRFNQFYGNPNGSQDNQQESQPFGDFNSTNNNGSKDEPFSDFGSKGDNSDR